MNTQPFPAALSVSLAVAEQKEQFAGLRKQIDCVGYHETWSSLVTRCLISTVLMSCLLVNFLNQGVTQDPLQVSALFSSCFFLLS